jgi:hypothetical protein
VKAIVRKGWIYAERVVLGTDAANETADQAPPLITSMMHAKLRPESNSTRRASSSLILRWK